MLSSHTWLVATILDSADKEHFHHYEVLLENMLYSMSNSKNIFSKAGIPPRLLYCLQGENPPFSQLKVKSGFLVCGVYSYEYLLMF